MSSIEHPQTNGQEEAANNGEIQGILGREVAYYSLGISLHSLIDNKGDSFQTDLWHLHPDSDGGW